MCISFVLCLCAVQVASVVSGRNLSIFELSEIDFVSLTNTLLRLLHMNLRSAHFRERMFKRQNTQDTFESLNVV